MPIGPKGQKRSRDPNQLAKLIVDIATGQVEDREPTPEQRGEFKAKEAAHRARRSDSGNMKKPPQKREP
jgi:hypothetical protein